MEFLIVSLITEIFMDEEENSTRNRQSTWVQNECKQLNMFKGYSSVDSPNALRFSGPDLL